MLTININKKECSVDIYAHMKTAKNPNITLCVTDSSEDLSGNV